MASGERRVGAQRRLESQSADGEWRMVPDAIRHSPFAMRILPYSAGSSGSKGFAAGFAIGLLGCWVQLE